MQPAPASFLLAVSPTCTSWTGLSFRCQRPSVPQCPSKVPAHHQESVNSNSLNPPESPQLFPPGAIPEVPSHSRTSSPLFFLRETDLRCMRPAFVPHSFPFPPVSQGGTASRAVSKCRRRTSRPSSGAPTVWPSSSPLAGVCPSRRFAIGCGARVSMCRLRLMAEWCHSIYPSTFIYRISQWSSLVDFFVKHLIFNNINESPPCEDECPFPPPGAFVPLQPLQLSFHPDFSWMD